MEKQSLKSVGEDDRRALLKEVLARANREQKQEYRVILSRQIEIAKRLQEIQLEIKVLKERERNNEYPKTDDNSYHAPDKTHGEIMDMSNGELHEWSEQIKKETTEYTTGSGRWNEKMEIWRAKDNVIFDEKLKLFDESIKLNKEFYNIGEEEKWLLLSIALRSQPTLMKYMTNRDDK